MIPGRDPQNAERNGDALLKAGPLVSIVIPCYNAEAFVGEAIESALNQTYPNVEVIVVDDGSTDGSVDVIRSFGERVRWETGPNHGGGAARNRGIEISCGELIQFLDSDDVLAAGKLARMVPNVLARGSGHLVFCDWERVGEAADVSQIQGMRCTTEDSVVCCARSGLLTPAPLHWRRNLDAVGGFDPELPCSQERDLHLRLACNDIRFVRIPEVLVQVRRRAGSVSSDSLRVVRQHLPIVHRASALLEARGGLNAARRSALAGFLARDARVLLRAGLRGDARDYFREARSLHPNGGWDQAYLPLHGIIARTIGPEGFERLVNIKRHWFPGARAR